MIGESWRVDPQDLGEGHDSQDADHGLLVLRHCKISEY